MALQISKQHIGKMHERVQSLQNRIAKIKDKTEEATAKFVRSCEVGGAAFASGVIQGRFGGMEIMGVPVELGAGIALNVLGYFGAAGKHSDHLINIGDGALAGYLSATGRGLGAEWAGKDAAKAPDAQKQVAAAAANAAATTAASKGVTLSPGEIAAITQDTIQQMQRAGH